MKLRIILCGSALFLAGIVAGWYGKTIRSATTGQALLSVPDVYQSSRYSCGASALQAVLAYWGIEVHEDTLAKSLGTTERYGTSPESILRVAKSYGLRAEMRENLSVANVAAALRMGVPVILDIQAWRDDRDAHPSNWDEDWEDGHYVVALGLDSTNVYVEDPSLLGCRGLIPLKELESRWRDYEGDPPHDSSKRSYVRMAIFIEGTKRATLATYCRVE
jgi:predicted double-glycine peptidase